MEATFSGTQAYLTPKPMFLLFSKKYLGSSVCTSGLQRVATSVDRTPVEPETAEEPALHSANIVSRPKEQGGL